MLELSLISPSSLVFQGEVNSVTLPVGWGEITVLPGHARLVSTVGKGKLICRSSAMSYYDVDKGFLEVADNKITILVSSIKPVQ